MFNFIHSLHIFGINVCIGEKKYLQEAGEDELKSP